MTAETETALAVAEIEKLVTEAQEILERVAEHTVQVGEEIVRTIEHDFADPTQLRVAVHRLGLFEQHLDTLKADEPVRQERMATEADEDGMVSATVKTIAGAESLRDMTRADLNDRAETLGVDDPDSLPNKQAVIDAIREADERAESGDEDDFGAEE